jgi:hypothetical protein
MAFKDIVQYMYGDSIKIDYKDKAHRYYAYPRVNWEVPVTDKKAWGKNLYAKGTTTLLDDTLEKKGLMTWPMGMALGELFGFYNFEGDNGDKMLGFSKGKGTMWQDGKTLSVDQETLLPIVKSASEAWIRKRQKGADIGSIVHAAIEAYIKAYPNDFNFNILVEYTKAVNEADYDSDAAKEAAIEQVVEDVAQAELAFNRFVQWWEDKEPELVNAEEILYSKNHNICGTYDGLVRLNDKLVMMDWKTSNASKSRAAAMPQGIGYTYFIQDAIYELCRREMGEDPADDLGVVSVRKDGGFNVILASELGLTVEDCIAWAEAVIACYRFMDKTKKALIAKGDEVENNVKKEF